VAIANHACSFLFNTSGSRKTSGTMPLGLIMPLQCYYAHVSSSSSNFWIRFHCHYLAFSDNHVSDQRLMEHIQYWFSGRSVHYSVLLFTSYRPHTTASLIELLLYSENPLKHRVLTAFIHYLTGFMITDAKDLEDEEATISAELTDRIETYSPCTMSV